jgi:hypothetical protein
MVKAWWQPFCEQDPLESDKPFDAARWKAGTPDVRGEMIRDFICSGMWHRQSRASVVALLGPSDSYENLYPSGRGNPDFLVYRVARSQEFHKHEPRVPEGGRRLENTYDVRIRIHDDKVSFITVFPVWGADS